MYLFQTTIQEGVPTSVTEVLHDNAIRKVGVALVHDTIKLHRDGIIRTEAFQKPSRKSPFPATSGLGFFDVGIYAKLHIGIPAPGVTLTNPMGSNHGLDSLAREFLNLHVEKSQFIFVDWNDIAGLRFVLQPFFSRSNFAIVA